MIDQLVFDITDANTRADSHQVGAVAQGVRANAVQLINSQAINSLEWLNTASATFAGDGTAISATGSSMDVNITNAITATCDLDGVFNGGSNTDPDNVGLISHTRAASLTDTQQVERTTAAALGNIASASVGNVNALDTNSFLMAINNTTGDAEQLQFNNTNGGLEVFLTGSDPLTINDAALANTAIANAVNTLAVANTAENIVAAPLANRKYLHVYNNDNRRIFVGQSGVSAANGFPLAPRSYLELRAGAAIDIEWVSAKVNHNIRTLELS